jgi:hypothetical protein
MSDLLDVLGQPPFQPVEQVGIAVVDDERDGLPNHRFFRPKTRSSRRQCAVSVLAPEVLA